ncbi:MAG: hypothetical protein ACHREM_31085 [Polyangiales bacterium]
MTTNKAHIALGAVVLVAVAGAYPAALATVPDTAELSVVVDTPTAVVIASRVGAPEPDIWTTPPDIDERLRDAFAPKRPREGLSLHTLSTEFGGGRWTREVTIPSWTGPFVERSDAWTCGVGAWIGAGVFDTSGALGGLLRRARERVGTAIDEARRSAPVPIADVEVVGLNIAPQDGRFDIHLSIKLTDATWFDVKASAKLTVDAGSLRVVRTSTDTKWGGPLRDDHPFLTLFTLGLYDDLATSRVNTGIDAAFAQAVSELNDVLGRAQTVNQWDASVRLSVPSPPKVSTTGVSFALCARVPSFRARDAQVRPVRDDVGLREAAHGAGGSEIVVSATDHALSAATYLAWNGRALDRWLLEEVGRVGMPDQMRALTLVEDGIEIGVPPYIVVDSDGWSVVVANARLGTVHGTPLVLHGQLGVAIAGAGRAALSARVKAVHANCEEVSRGKLRLRPCLSDVMPTVRDSLGSIERVVALPSPPALTVAGESLRLSDARVSLSREGVATVAMIVSAGK